MAAKISCLCCRFERRLTLIVWGWLCALRECTLLNGCAPGGPLQPRSRALVVAEEIGSSLRRSLPVQRLVRSFHSTSSFIV